MRSRATIARGFGVTDTALTGGDRAIYRGEGPPKIPLRLIIVIVVIAVIVISNMSSRGGPPGYMGARRGRHAARISSGAAGSAVRAAASAGCSVAAAVAAASEDSAAVAASAAAAAEETSSVIEPFLTLADRVLGSGYSAVVSGSIVRGDHIPGRSDYNLLVVAERLGPAELKGLGPEFARFAAEHLGPPLLRHPRRMGRAADVFPIEIADMRTAYRVVRGTDPLAARAWARRARRALESEFRGKLLRLRLSLGLHSGDPGALAAAVGYSIGSIRVFFGPRWCCSSTRCPMATRSWPTGSRGCSAWIGGGCWSCSRIVAIPRGKRIRRCSSRTSGSSSRRPGSLTNITLESTDAFRTVFRAGHGPAPTSGILAGLTALTLSGCGYNTHPAQR